MIGWLTNLFKDQYRFRLVEPSAALPRCLIRPARTDELETCEEIYRLNEPDRFPEGYEKHFSELLRSNSCLTLVAVEDSELRGFGLLNVYYGVGFSAAMLSYGMVHPMHHGRGFGSALLLGRLSALSEPPNFYSLSLSPVETSTTFYQRFGFLKVGRFPDPHGLVFDLYRAHFYKADWLACKRYLEKSQVLTEISNLQIPTTKIGGNWRTYRT